MRFLILISILILPNAFGAIRVVTSTTDLAWTAKQIGGDAVEVQSLLQGTENPHYVDTIPDFVRKVADADVVCTVGLDLEVGWIPKVLARSGNSKVQSGGKGFCETGTKVSVLDKPTGPVDRSMGDVHPAGNPHFWLSPPHLIQASRQIVESLSQSDPVNRAKYEDAGKKFSERVKAFYEKEKKKIAAALGQEPGKVLEYHKEFSYLLDAYGLTSAGSLEEKPGVAPSAGRVAEVALAAKKSGVKLLLAAEYSPKSTLDKFTELSGIPVLRVPTSIPMGNLDYFAFHERLVDSLASAVKVSKVN